MPVHRTGARVQRFLEKTHVLEDECLSKGNRHASISTYPFCYQFTLKESQNSDFFPPILVDYWS